MKTSITNKIILNNLPSASGIEVINNVIYIIGDDSPYLYCLDLNFNLFDKITLFSSDDFSTGRIPKSLKADLECSTYLKYKDNQYLLLAGSGSKENRNTVYLFDINNKVIKDYSLKEIYLLFKNHLEDISFINIEALCADDKNIYFFNRANKSGANLILKIELDSFLNYLFNNIPIAENYSIYSIDLPDINRINSGFSGACIFNEKIFFTASVEDTSDPILDGEVLGSFIGIIDINSLKLEDYSLVNYNDDIFLGKIESIAILSEKYSIFDALVVTDNDLGSSELIELNITL